ncbi:MAG TPA: hypothetical protein VNU97_01590 [Rhizomicrobium sp.]|jgi:hypothetical protein|nr:hypothetical protein [Rhizomicrobium sp.]
MSHPMTENPAPRRVVPTEQARQGEATGHVRYVLGASLVLAVVAGVFLYVYFM